MLLAAACACATVAAGTATATSPAAQPSDVARLKAFARAIGVTCETTAGRLACIGGRPDVGDYADIDLHPDCGADGWFGVIAAKQPVELRDRISPLDTKTIAILARGQAVCIRAIGQVEGKPFYYFVSAIPHAPACAMDRSCDPPVESAIRGASKKPASNCRADAQRSLRNCASGWIQAGDLRRLPARPSTL